MDKDVVKSAYRQSFVTGMMSYRSMVQCSVLGCCSPLNFIKPQDAPALLTIGLGALPDTQLVYQDCLEQGSHTLQAHDIRAIDVGLQLSPNRPVML
ncbi:hypothetical protein [Devosia psychrophila]|uniref:Uncharacterized protein n=1 Tax=Devosia psychrophila TaxID=728005 RepID=A0ABR5E196_9HYPH|nr:hypothetical protein [Devosia psychrophila]KKC34093.1 hypothetical protein WH91_04840 [Devosia psychrophila]